VHKALVLMSITLPLILGTLLFGSSALYVFESYQNELFGLDKEKISVDLPVVQDDTLGWKTYQDKKTGFSIKYPDNWPDPLTVTPEGREKFIEKIVFENGLGTSEERFKRYEVFIYNAKKVAGPVGTDNLVAKNPKTFAAESCAKREFYDSIVGEGDYPAQEVDIMPNDNCFNKAYFFSVSRGGYIFNLVPTVPEIDGPFDTGIKPDIIAKFPKYFEVLSTLIIPEEERLVEVEKQNIQKRIVEKKVQPHRVLIHKATCAKKNHKGKKSKTKSRHMDEDCCIDPDESPNPRCQY